MRTIKSRPILFSGEMVRALLAGRKTQTRRIVKPKHLHGSQYTIKEVVHGATAQKLTANSDSAFAGFLHINDPHAVYYRCPFGAPGNLLWVREAYADIGPRLTYAADTDDGAHCQVKRWTPSIHMYRADSRLTLEITGVRVERLQEISHEDALAEGISPSRCYGSEKDCNAATWFAGLWASINGAESWEGNPWVWVIEFTVHHCNVDALIKQREAA